MGIGPQPRSRWRYFHGPHGKKDNEMLGGTHAKILHVNLTTGEIHIEQPPDDFYRLLVGGRAVVPYWPLRALPPHAAPLSPDTLLIFAPGIMQGTTLPGAGRHGVGGKS